MNDTAARSSLWEVTRLFFKLGAITFGGPAAGVAMMEEEIVRKRAWMARQDFLDLLAATNLALLLVVSWSLFRSAVSEVWRRWCHIGWTLCG